VTRTPAGEPPVTQEKHLPLRGRQPQHRLLKSLPKLPCLGLLKRSGSRIGHGLQGPGVLALGAPPPLAQLVDSEVPGNSKEPRSECRGRVVVLAMLKHAEEGFLKEILSALPITERSEQEVKHAAVVTIVERLKGG